MAKAKGTKTKRLKAVPKTVETPTLALSNGARKLKPPKSRWSFLRRRHVTPSPNRHPLPSSYQLFLQSLKFLYRHRRLFIGISIIYGLLSFILVYGAAGGTSLAALKSSLLSTFHGHGGLLSSIGMLSGYLINGSGSTSTSALSGMYRVILLIVVSLVLIWSLRQVYSGTVVRIRDGFYKGMYPLIPTLLVSLIIALELLPFIVGGLLIGVAVKGGITVNVIQTIVWAIPCLLLVILSLYWICSSIFSLYIVTLPDMTPLQALRTAKQLVVERRLIIVRKILFLPLALLALLGIIGIPIVLVITPAAQLVFFILSLFTLAVIHSYMYTLYRELI